MANDISTEKLSTESAAATQALGVAGEGANAAAQVETKLDAAGQPVAKESAAARAAEDVANLAATDNQALKPARPVDETTGLSETSESAPVASGPILVGAESVTSIGEASNHSETRRKAEAVFEAMAKGISMPDLDGNDRTLQLGKVVLTTGDEDGLYIDGVTSSYPILVKMPIANVADFDPQQLKKTLLESMKAISGVNDNYNLHDQTWESFPELKTLFEQAGDKITGIAAAIKDWWAFQEQDKTNAYAEMEEDEGRVKYTLSLASEAKSPTDESKTLSDYVTGDIVRRAPQILEMVKQSLRAKNAAHRDADGNAVPLVPEEEINQLVMLVDSGTKYYHGETKIWFGKPSGCTDTCAPAEKSVAGTSITKLIPEELKEIIENALFTAGDVPAAFYSKAASVDQVLRDGIKALKGTEYEPQLLEQQKALKERTQLHPKTPAVRIAIKPEGQMVPALVTIKLPLPDGKTYSDVMAAIAENAPAAVKAEPDAMGDFLAGKAANDDMPRSDQRFGKLAAEGDAPEKPKTPEETTPATGEKPEAPEPRTPGEDGAVQKAKSLLASNAPENLLVEPKMAELKGKVTANQEAARGAA